MVDKFAHDCDGWYGHTGLSQATANLQQWLIRSCKPDSDYYNTTSIVDNRSYRTRTGHHLTQ